MTGTILNNTYKLEQELSRSSNFILFRGINLETQHHVAVKTVLPAVLESHPDFTEHFLAAAQDCARLTHPGINSIIEAGQDQGILFATTNFIEGRPLSQYMQKHGTLTIEETAAIVAELAAALNHIHAKGYIHRNIKPDNIILWKGSLTPIFTDFGILKPEFIYPEQAGAHTIVSPEQAAGLPYTASSDIFVLGFLTYVMLTGKQPFQDGEQKFSAPPVRLRNMLPEVAEDVEKAVMRALSREPAYRFATAGDFARAFCKDILPHIEDTLDAARTAQHKARPDHTKSPVREQGAPLVPAMATQPHTTQPTFAPGNMCAEHPEYKAVSYCIRCGKPLCPQCERLENGRPHCGVCRPTGARARLSRSAQQIKPGKAAMQSARASLRKPLWNKELRRIAAVSLDGLAIMLGSVPMTFLFWAVSIKLMPEVHGLTFPVSYYVSLLFTGSIYYIGAHYRWGRTLGKHALGLNVRHTDGRPLTLLGAAWRWVGFLTALIWAFVGFWLMQNLFNMISLARRIGGAESLGAGMAILLRAISVLVFLILASGALITFVGKFKRGFHDILAGSIVINLEWMERRIASESQGREVPGPVHRQ
jgi:uncharacterized RDD family membrane protein YckC